MTPRAAIADGAAEPAPAQGLDPRGTEASDERTPLLKQYTQDTQQDSSPLHDSATVDPKPTDPDTHYRNISPSRFWWLFSGILFGNLIAFFDGTLMASSHPVITSYFNASNAASWLSTVFYLTSTVFQPIYGRVSDTVGRRPVYLFAISVFFCTTVWCASAQSIGSFIAARAVCGLGAGGVLSVGFIIISDVVRIEYRGLYQSYFNIFYGIGNSLGAAFGGLLCDRLGWRAAFGIQLPFIFTYLVLAFFTTPTDLGPNLARSEGKSLVEAFKSFDVAGSVCLTIGVSCLILGINLGGNIFPWVHPVPITSLALFAVTTPMLLWAERRAVRPILPLRLLSSIPIANLMYSNFFSAIAIQTVFFNAPLFLQAVRQVSPTNSGLYLITALVGGTIGSVIAGFYITWTRRMKPTMVVGVLMTLAGAIAASCLQPGLPVWLVLLLIPGASTGQSFLFPSSTIAVLALSAQEDQAVVTTTLGLVRNLGSVMGVAISSWVLQNALLMCLNRTVTGDEEVKQRIIMMVRKSIKAIGDLDPFHKAQVIEGYSQALRATFLSGTIFAIMVVVLVLPIRIPRLQEKS